MDSDPDKQHTPSDILMRCLEEFGEDEPIEVAVIYRTKSGDLAWSTDITVHSHFVGLLRMTEFWFLEDRKLRDKK